MKTHKSVVCKCERCNKPFKSYIKEEHMLCKSCKAAEKRRRNKVAMTLKCKDCGDEFHINVGEKEWYESKGLCLPVRCSFCRAKRRGTTNE